MTPFIILFIYLYIAWAYPQRYKNIKKRTKVQCVLFAIGLIFLLGFHSPDLGVDVANYYVPLFEGCEREELSFQIVGQIEPLFHAFSVLIKKCTDSIQIYLFITSLLIVIPVVFLFYKESKNIWLSIFFYTTFTLYYFAFSGLRQAIAISIVCIGYYFLLKGNWKMFLPFVFIAFFFHISAVIAIIAYPLMKAKLSDISWFLLFGVFGMAIIAAPSIMMFFVDLIFSDTGKYQNTLNEGGGGITFAFLYLAFAALQIFLAQKGKQRSMVQITLLLFIIQLTGMKSDYASRIGYYFLPLFFVFLPNMIAGVKEKGFFKLLNVSISIFLILLFIYSNSGGYLEVIPFKFFWE